MSAALSKLKEWVDGEMTNSLRGVTVHLQGRGNEEIAGGGYAPKPFSTFLQWQFGGKTPLIYGFFLQAGGKRVYSEALKEPWQALSAGDVLSIDLTVEVKTKIRG